MRMTSPNREKRLPVNRTEIATILVVVIVCIGIVFMRPTLTDALVGIWSHIGQGSTMLHGAAESFSSNAALESENANLQAELASTTALLADRNTLYQENLDLENRLGRDGSTKTILATVLMEPPALPYDVLVIDAGSRDGVAQSDLVSAGGTLLIGVVSSVYDTTSRVTLFSTPGETYSASLSSQSGALTPVAVVGEGGGSLVAKVPLGTMASIGDSIILPTLTGGFMATVSGVVAPQDQSFETLYLQMPVNPFTLHYVEVWKQ